MTLRSIFLLGTAFVPISMAHAQSTPAPETQLPAVQQQAEQEQLPDELEDDDESIVITGQRPRGSVVGDIPPERTFDSRDVRATGATNINELLDALAPEIGSSRGRGGGRPVLLLNGQRISGFRELRDIPTEAISRMEVLPEEVALKYGYRADQRVVNIVLRERFRSTTAEARGTAATEGGYAGATGDLTRLLIQRNTRTQLNLHAENNGMLTEAERDITLEPGQPDDRSDRSLVGRNRQVRGSATVNRTILSDVSATFNGELEHSSGRSLLGLGDTLLEPLARNTTTNSAHLGSALNWNEGDWRLSVTGNADLSRGVSTTDRDSILFPEDRARTTTASGDVAATANGKLFSLPAGDASTTVRVGASTVQLDGSRKRAGVATESSLGRSAGNAAINVDLPISRRNRDISALGNLTLNVNAEIEQLSDFGTLTTVGAGANWSPADRVNIIASWTREDGSPAIQQLGDPVLETPDARIFDFTRGETALVTAISGGNPDLLADTRTVFKLGGNWQPLADTDLRLRADYVRSSTDNPISGISATPSIEAAFPGRFVRDGSGMLTSVDLRPVNFDRARRDTLQLGFSFSKPLRSRRPSQALRDRMRARFGIPPGSPSLNQEGGPPPGEGAGERRRGGRGFGGGGMFGGSRGRLQFSLTDTITLVDRVRIRPGIAELDYLDGEALGSTGGRPRHQVEARAGWSNNGLGARLSADWRSGTRVDSLTGDDLRFSPYSTFDLRLFANLGEQPELVFKNPWLRGTSVRFEVNNIFDSKPKVRDAAGSVPLNYQPDLLDPLGRTVMISFRKLLMPSPGAFRRMREQERQQQDAR